VKYFSASLYLLFFFVLFCFVFNCSEEIKISAFILFVCQFIPNVKKMVFLTEIYFFFRWKVTGEKYHAIILSHATAYQRDCGTLCLAFFCVLTKWYIFSTRLQIYILPLPYMYRLNKRGDNMRKYLKFLHFYE